MNSCQIEIYGLVIFIICTFAIIITLIKTSKYNSVIFTADEAKELSNRRVKKNVERAIKNLNDRVTAAARNGTHHITQNLKVVTPSCGDLYLGRVGKDDFPWCVKQIRSYFEGRSYSVKIKDKEIIKISW